MTGAPILTLNLTLALTLTLTLTVTLTLTLYRRDAGRHLRRRTAGHPGGGGGPG